ncbi:MAG: MFS transporter [Chloroflexi bacterium]|nr:MFS transporter [Chloroflexota bacterium]
MATTLPDGTISRFHWKIEIFGGVPLLLNALDIGVPSFALAQLVGLWGLSPMQIGVVAMASAIGSLPGSIFFGHLTDRIGRRSTLRLSLSTMAIGTALGAVSWDYLSLAAFQLIAGLGLGGTTPAVSAFVGEFAPAKHRGRLTTMMETFYVMGSLLAALGSLFILTQFGWRIAFVYGGLPLLWVLVLHKFMPESPRYLISRGRLDEARQFLAQVKERYGLSYDHLVNNPAHENGGLIASLREIWSGPLARRTACTWLLSFVMVYASFGIFVWLPTLLTASGLEILRTIQYMLVLTVIQIPAVLAAAFLVDKVGRKWLLAPAFLVCGGASYAFGRAGSPVEVLFWGSLISLSLFMVRGVWLAYTAELFPTRLRGTGAGSASAFGRVAGIIVPGAIAVLIGTWSNGYEMVFVMFAAVLFAGALSTVVLGEETKGRTLEEIAATAPARNG